MRGILFRGMTKNQEWVEGGYCNGYEQTLDFVDGCRQCLHHYIAVDTIANRGLPNKMLLYSVLPKTIGQYTGLCDKNGTKIFEGDIIKYTFDSPDDPTATENGLKERIGRVFWSDWRASFAVTGGRNGSTSLNQDVARYVRGRQIYEYARGANTVEVIGNIYENKELLEEDNG